jgi:hypothetical protein
MADAADVAIFFDRPIAFHRALVGVVGGVTAALMLSQAIYWQRIVDKKEVGGWWYKTGAEWLDETGLTSAGVRDSPGRGRERPPRSSIRGPWRTRNRALSRRLEKTRIARPVCGRLVPQTGERRSPCKQGCGKPASEVRGYQQSPELQRFTRRLRGASHQSALSKRRKLNSLPDDFALSDRVTKWCAERRLPMQYVGEQLEAFKSNARAKDMRYADWDEAFMTWMRRQPQFDKTRAARRGAKPACRVDRRSSAACGRGPMYSSDAR